MMLTLGLYGGVDFYDLKGIIEELFNVLGIEDYSFEPETGNPSFHPGRTARIMVGNNEIGLIGEIHPDVVKNFDSPERVYIGTLEVLPLVENSSTVVTYKPLPKYPAVTRDIAMLIRDEIPVRDIESLIKMKAGKILEQLKLFDVYKGKQVPEGMKSVAYSITFRAEDRTLTDEDVNKAMDKILDGLKTNFEAQLR
jgi:phenylalanyl-tRNA synthetase beta chain